MKRFCAFGTFTGLNTTAFSTLKTTPLTPIPSASARIAVTVNPADFVNFRNATLTSLVISPVLASKYGRVRHLVPLELRSILFSVPLFAVAKLAILLIQQND